MEAGGKRADMAKFFWGGERSARGLENFVITVPPESSHATKEYYRQFARK